ncbi:MAG: hypothetical protein PF503_14935 [Desulfobacula sp.]|jgi:hypothetical protein|nr:hypothetical protein [Desulfobacula sp.]
MKKLIVLIAAMVMVAGYASAAEWNFYGSARVSTFWNSIDYNTVGVADKDNFAQGLQGNARIGAKVKVSDELTGGFEYGAGVNVRKLYGEWNFGGGSFLVGQTYSPLNLFYSNQVYGSDNDLLAQGGVYSGREQMLRLKYGPFKIAVVPVNTTSMLGGTTEVAIPAIEASFSKKIGAVSFGLAGGYQTFEETVGVVTYDVDSYVLAVGAKVNFGMAYFGGNIYTGQNPGTMISVDNGGGWASGGYASAGVTDTLDADVFGYLAVAGAKINDMFSVEFGYAAITEDLDDVALDNESASYYAQATITIAPGVYVIPEVGVIDHDGGVAVDKNTYVGAKWMINF